MVQSFGHVYNTINIPRRFDGVVVNDSNRGDEQETNAQG
jgi:hypothetical protein